MYVQVFYVLHPEQYSPSGYINDSMCDSEYIIEYTNWQNQTFINGEYITHIDESEQKLFTSKVSNIIFEDLIKNVYHPTRHPKNYLSTDDMVDHPYENLTQRELRELF